MTDLRPLERSTLSTLERQLLDSADHDGPSPQRRAALLAGLGLSAGAGILTTTTAAQAASASSATAAGALSGAANASSLATSAACSTPVAFAGAGASGGAAGTALGGVAATKLALVKWIGVGLLAGSVTSLGASAISAPTTAPREPVTTTARTQSASQPVAPNQPTRQPAAGHAIPAPEEVPSQEAPTLAKAATSATPARVSVARELTLLDQVRQASAQGNSERALALLRSYERSVPSKALAPEADLLSIEAQLGAGKRAQARAQAEHFLQRYPHSPHRERVRRLLQRASTSSGAGGVVQTSQQPRPGQSTVSTTSPAATSQASKPAASHDEVSAPKPAATAAFPTP